MVGYPRSWHVVCPTLRAPKKYRRCPPAPSRPAEVSARSPAEHTGRWMLVGRTASTATCRASSAWVAGASTQGTTSTATPTEAGVAVGLSLDVVDAVAAGGTSGLRWLLAALQPARSAPATSAATARRAAVAGEP